VRKVEGTEKVWQIEGWERLTGAAFTPLPDAVPVLPDGTKSSCVFGVLSGRALSPRPAGGGMYVVKLADAEKPDAERLELGFSFEAYIDLFGRVFSCDGPLEAPPARRPDVEIAHFPEQGGGESNGGYVYVRDNVDGPARAVAEYQMENRLYSLVGGWYDFGEHAQGLPYSQVLARAYLAFSHRPSLGAPLVPALGVDKLLDGVSSEKPLAGLYDLVDSVRAAELDPQLHAPALVDVLVDNLERAGLLSVRARRVPDGAVRMVKSTSYAHTRYLSRADETSFLLASELWGIEAAMNRFTFVADALGDDAASASEELCREADALLFELTATQKATGEAPVGVAAGGRGGDWDMRCRIACMIEQLRLPMRVGIEFRYDVAAGQAVFSLMAPGPNLMPAGSGEQAVGAADPADAVAFAADDVASADALATKPARPKTSADAARTYAMSVALLLASNTFSLHDTVNGVRVIASPLVEEAQPEAAPVLGDLQCDLPSESGEEVAPEVEELSDSDAAAGATASSDAVAAPDEPAAAIDQPANESANSHVNSSPNQPISYFDVEFPRDLWESLAHFSAYRSGDPKPAFDAAGAQFDIPKVELPTDATMRPVFEAWRSPAAATLPPDAQLALGAHDVRDLDIEYDTVYRSMAENVADELAGVESATEAIRVVRTFSDQAVSDHDERGATACARLMKALAEGTLEASDQNAVVSRFLGDDRCLVALGRARSLAQSSPDQAVQVLADAISETRLIDGVVDGGEVAYRYFDSYANRIVYNLARAGRLDVCEDAAADAGKRVLPAPDSFLMCHLEIVPLLERSFKRSDDALRYGRDMVALAPTCAMSYRTLGRAYMLMGDMDHARQAIVAGLAVALTPVDVSLLYYQLGYVMWKSGRFDAAVACYLKSVAVSPAVAVQATAELQQMATETRIVVPARANLDDQLRAADIPVAPNDQIIDVLDVAAQAAADAGLAHVARSALAVRVRYRPDDALMDVLRSFGE
jgi:hypothetical protein